MNLSVIICTYNRDKYIYNVLKSIAENDFSTGDYEIVLVNNNSTDHTADEVKRFQRDFPEINFCSCIEERQGLSHARNKGIEESSGDILIYVDDDATVNKTYLSAYSTLFKTHPDIYAAGGPIIPTYEDGAEPRWMNYHLRRLLTGYLYFGDKEKPFPGKNYPGGGNAAYRRVVFEKVGQYNPKLGRKGTNLAAGEEKDIFDKMTSAGMKYIYSPNAILYHIIPHYKLERGYLERVTLGIGSSERTRTLAISKAKYCRRLISELIKWGGTLVLWFYHLLRLHPSSGNRLIFFRYNVTRGLTGKKLPLPS